MAIERKAELCLDGGGLQPCQHCGSTAAIIRLNGTAPAEIQRICCGSDPWWRSAASRAWFSDHGVSVATAAREARRG